MRRKVRSRGSPERINVSFFLEAEGDIEKASARRKIRSEQYRRSANYRMV